MSNTLAAFGRGAAYKLVFIQLVSVLVIALGFLVTKGSNAFISSLCGGVTVVLPNFVFASFAFAHAGASVTNKVLSAFYWGAAIKMALTIALFSLAFKFIENVSFMALFVTYVLGLCVHWLAPLYFKKK